MLNDDYGQRQDSSEKYSEDGNAIEMSLSTSHLGVQIDDDQPRTLWDSVKQCFRRSYFIFGLIVLVVTISAFDWILWKKALNKFSSKHKSLSFFVLQIYVFWMLLYSGITCLLLIYVFRTIDAETRRFPQIKFFYMSCFDTFSTFAAAISGPFVAGHIQTLLNQGMQPLLMIFSILVLAAKYTPPQYIGAAFILIGTVAAAVPAVLEPTSSESGHGTESWAIILYSLSSIPYAMGNVYREYLFSGRKEVNIFYMMFWTSLYQFLLSFLTLPILSIRALGGTSITEYPEQFKQGGECFMGYVVEGLTCEEGPTPGQLLFIYVCLNFIQSVFRLMLIKHSSAVMLQVANAIALLLTNILFSVEEIMGKDTEKFNKYDAIGLSLVLIGFIIFRVAIYLQNNENNRNQRHLEDELRADGLEIVRRQTDQDTLLDNSTQEIQKYSDM